MRLVGDRRAPLIYIDVKIFQRPFNAMINTSLQNTSVNRNVIEWICSSQNQVISPGITEIEVPFKMDGVITFVECEINYDQKEDIELGTHFLQYHGFKISFNEAVVSSESPIVPTKSGIRYLYNSTEHGAELKQYLRRQKFFLRRDKCNESEDHNNNRIVIIRKS